MCCNLLAELALRSSLPPRKDLLISFLPVFQRSNTLRWGGDRRREDGKALEQGAERSNGDCSALSKPTLHSSVLFTSDVDCTVAQYYCVVASRGNNHDMTQLCSSIRRLHDSIMVAFIGATAQ